MKKHLYIIIENEPNSFSRVVSLFSQRAYKIEKLTITPSKFPTLHNVFIEIKHDEKTTNQIEKQLKKLINVIKVKKIYKKDYVDQEILLVKIKINSLPIEKSIQHILDNFKIPIININSSFFIVKIVGKQKQLETILNSLKEKAHILEIARSGAIFMSKK